LTREQVGGVWVYRAVQSREKVLRDVVKDFVERTLGGSLEPFALYLADPTNVTKEDLAQLRAIVDKLDDAKESRDA
jgi:predicted transcriptional regulator